MVGDTRNVDHSEIGYFQSLGVPIISDTNDSLSDVEKALYYLRNDKSVNQLEKSLDTVIIYDGAGRHWNKHLSIIHTLFKVC